MMTARHVLLVVLSCYVGCSGLIRTDAATLTAQTLAPNSMGRSGTAPRRMLPFDVSKQGTVAFEITKADAFRRRRLLEDDENEEGEEQTEEQQEQTADETSEGEEEQGGDGQEEEEAPAEETSEEKQEEAQEEPEPTSDEVPDDESAPPSKSAHGVRARGLSLEAREARRSARLEARNQRREKRNEARMLRRAGRFGRLKAGEEAEKAAENTAIATSIL